MMSQTPPVKKLLDWMDKRIELDIKGETDQVKPGYPKYTIWSGHDSSVSTIQMFMKNIFGTKWAFPSFSSSSCTSYSVLSLMLSMFSVISSMMPESANCFAWRIAEKKLVASEEPCALITGLEMPISAVPPTSFGSRDRFISERSLFRTAAASLFFALL